MLNLFKTRFEQLNSCCTCMLNLYFFLSIVVDVWSHSDTLRGACQFLKGNKMSSTVRYEKIWIWINFIWVLNIAPSLTLVTVNNFCQYYSVVETKTSSPSKTLVLRQNTSGIQSLLSGLQVSPLPPPKKRNPNIAHAPKRNHRLSVKDQKVSIARTFKFI